MTDIALQLDETLAGRLRALAQARGCSVEHLIAQLLQELLPAADPAVEPNQLGPIATHWNQEEVAFLEDAVQAFSDIPVDDAVKPTDLGEWDKPLR